MKTLSDMPGPSSVSSVVVTITMTVDKVLSTAIELPPRPQETHFSYSA